MTINREAIVRFFLKATLLAVILLMFIAPNSATLTKNLNEDITKNVVSATDSVGVYTYDFSAATTLGKDIGAQWSEISASKAKIWMDSSENTILLDIRDHEEYTARHIDKAFSFPLYEMGCDSCIKKTLARHKNGKIIVYSEDDLFSRKACDILVKHGFKHVYYISGGIDAWESSGFPIKNGQHGEKKIYETIYHNLRENKPVFLFFYTPLCEYCQKQIHVVDELKERYVDKIYFVYINVDEYAVLAEDFHVSSYPTMFLIFNISTEGFVYKEFRGYTDKNELENFFIGVHGGDMSRDVLFSDNADSVGIKRDDKAFSYKSPQMERILSPTIPFLVSPANGSTLETAVPKFNWTHSFNPTGVPVREDLSHHVPSDPDGEYVMWREIVNESIIKLHFWFYSNLTDEWSEEYCPNNFRFLSCEVWNDRITECIADGENFGEISGCCIGCNCTVNFTIEIINRTRPVTIFMTDIGMPTIDGEDRNYLGDKLLRDHEDLIYCLNCIHFDDCEILLAGLCYELMIDDDPYFGSPEVYERNIHVPKYKLDKEQFLTPGRYYWRVRACNETTCSDWSESWCFNVTIVDESFVRGDIDGNRVITITDVVYLINHLFPIPHFPCMDAADVNDDGSLNIADASYLLTHLFPTSQLPQPFPECGPDPTPDDLNCWYHQHCMDEGCS